MKNKVILKTAMLFTAVFLFMIFLPVKVFAENEYTVTEMTAEGEVISDVNVRMGPATSYDIIGTVRAKDIVAISGITGDGWYRIDYQGQTGFVYGDYISVTEKEPEPTPEAETAQQPEPDASGRDFGPLRLAAIVVIIIVIIIMIVLTIRSFIQGSRDDDDEDEEDDDDDDDGEDGESAEEGLTKAEEEPGQKEKKKSDEDGEKVKTIVIREEDYQLHIDPKYFEDEPLSQPEYVTDYLKKMESENTQPTKPLAKKETSDDLTRAMKKLEELQEEIERLKRKQ